MSSPQVAGLHNQERLQNMSRIIEQSPGTFRASSSTATVCAAAGGGGALPAIVTKGTAEVVAFNRKEAAAVGLSAYIKSWLSC
jgi:hypothetical protein